MLLSKFRHEKNVLDLHVTATMNLLEWRRRDLQDKETAHQCCVCHTNYDTYVKLKHKYSK